VTWWGRRIAGALMGTLALLCAAARADAQVDPRGPVRSFTTTHFHVHFPARLDSLAREAAVYAEAAYGQLSGELVAPRGRIDLLLTDNVDASNGYAQVFPTPRMVIYAVPPITSQELRYGGDWLRVVITHELAHIFHLDRARGVWALGRWVFGRSPVLFPNGYTPSWVKEGLAVHYESKFTGFGRLVSTEFPLTARAAALDSLLPPLGRWSLSTTRYPRGGTAYTYGSLLMERAADRAVNRDGKGMRRYVEATAATAIPYLLQANARTGFGETFTATWQRYRDSLMAATSPLQGTPASEPFTWESPAGFYAAHPRWLSNDSLVWSASDGRDVVGAYMADVRGGTARRIAWRNGLDVNVAAGGDGRGGAGGVRAPLVYAQPDYRDPYVVRSDLYRGEGRAQQRITAGARLVHPDVRRDGAIVAVQLDAGTSHLVRVDGRGGVQRLVSGAGRAMWAEPRWSPDGAWIAAVQRLSTGEQRIVVLDTLGNVWQAVAGSRGVYTSPSWTPDGTRLLWASDRSGRMQLETAPLGDRDLLDTTRWQAPREDVRQVTQVRTGVYDPSLSPDGRRVAVVVQRGDGLHVAVLPFDTIGTMAENRWYAAEEVPLPVVPEAPRIERTPVERYAVLRQLLPRYWMPNVGEGRDGRATFGFTSSSFDILERHQWEATVLVEPARRETDVYASYRYAGLGVPVFDVAASQEWDATFRAVNDSGTTLGLIARRRRFTTVASTWSVPRIRLSVSGTLGAQYEWRDFTATVDSALGDPGSLLRTGTRYPSLFLNTGVSTARRALRGVSVEEGVALSTSTSYRWRQDAPSLGSWRTLLTGRAFVPLPLPGYARHVIALRTSAGYADRLTANEFQIGGTSGVQAELVPGVTIGDPARAFAVRGVAPGVQRGIRALGGMVEYRAPLVMLREAPSPFTVYTDRVSLALFSDAGRAWCPASLAGAVTSACERPGVRDGWIASAGGELVIDLAVAYDEPYRLRLGAAAPYVAPAGVPRRGAVYLTLGGYF
jgi:hypothetical protein